MSCTILAFDAVCVYSPPIANFQQASRKKQECCLNISKMQTDRNANFQCNKYCAI